MSLAPVVLLLKSMNYFAAKRAATASQLTTFHQALT